MSVARRNLKGAGAQSSDPTNRNRIPGRPRGVTRQWTGMPNRHPDTRPVDPAGPEGRTQRLTWEISFAVRHEGLPAWQHGGKAGEKSAEAIVGRSHGKASEAPQSRKVRKQIGRAARDGRRAEFFGARSQSGTTRWVQSDSQAPATSSGYSRKRSLRNRWTAGRRRRAPASAAKAEPDLPRARSRKRPRRWTQHEP